MVAWGVVGDLGPLYEGRVDLPVAGRFVRWANPAEPGGAHPREAVAWENR